MTDKTGIERLLEIMVTLRDPERGCPWDREQSFATIVPFTIEEAYEVADAIERGDMDELRDELGDLLFQVVFYAQLAAEAGHFDFDAVVDAIVAKLTRRHPHVFGDVRVDSAAQQSEEWERHKAAERAAKSGETVPSVLDGVGLALPALSRAVKLQRRAARVGFDWRELSEVLDKVGEELDEVRVEVMAGAGRARLTHEIGDLLLACSNLARFAELDPEAALREANGRFERRFRRIEEWLAAEGRRPEQSSLEEMEQLWRRAKGEELTEE
jgi:ATP diphosphatase